VKEKRMLYFAYGSNMNHDQMRHRCTGTKFIVKAYLENYAFVYDSYSSARYGAVANIIPEEGSVVWGGLWEIGDDAHRLQKKGEALNTDASHKTLEVWRS